MTVFSYPSELVDPYPETDDWFNGGIARATSDIAIAAWSSQRYDQTPFLVPMHLSAVRYTDAGPEIGPLLTIEAPSQIVIYEVVEGPDTQVWVMAAERMVPGIRFGLVDVNIETLELTFSWKFGIPSYWNPGDGGVVVASWPEMNLIAIATNEGDPVQTSATSWVRLVDTSTGTVIQSVQTPPYDPDSATNTRTVYAESIALHKGAGRLLLTGDWYHSSTGIYRPGLWSITVADTGFTSGWTWVANVPSPNEGYYYFNTRWSVMAATADGWSLLFMGTYYWGTANWFHIALDGTLTPGDQMSNVANTSNYNMRRAYDCAYDIAYDRSIGCCMTYGSWAPGSGPDVYLKGFLHLEATGAQITNAIALPGSENTDYISMVNVAVVGPGRYVYLCASTGILQPRGSGYLDSFGQVTYVGGEHVDISFRAGGQADTTQRTFHTVRTG